MAVKNFRTWELQTQRPFLLIHKWYFCNLIQTHQPISALGRRNSQPGTTWVYQHQFRLLYCKIARFLNMPNYSTSKTEIRNSFIANVNPIFLKFFPHVHSFKYRHLYIHRNVTTKKTPSTTFIITCRFNWYNPPHHPLLVSSGLSRPMIRSTWLQDENWWGYSQHIQTKYTLVSLKKQIAHSHPIEI